MSFSIRPTTLADKDAIEPILEASYSTLLQGFYDADTLARAVPIMSKAQPDLLTSGTYYAATIDEKIVACGGWTLAVPGTKKVRDASIAHIRHVATHPDHLRKGLAKAIMTHCFDAAQAIGVTKFSCFSSLAAVTFYESVGFIAGEQKTVSFAPDLPFPMVVMTLKL
ncbi:MAG: GNAT family N-acetyltransferase [Alphaproteobacteria bacterium]